MENIELAAKIALSRLKGKYDRAGKPLSQHAAAVGLALTSMGQEFVIVGLLHEVMKDPDVRLEDLKSLGFSNEVVRSLDALTARVGEDCSDYMVRVKRDPVSRHVKIADATDNLNLCLEYADSEHLNMIKRTEFRKTAKNYEQILSILLTD